MALKFESELRDAEPSRRVVIELPESRAIALATAIDSNITWDATEVADELNALYWALRVSA
jgi:hypothetical protein